MKQELLQQEKSIILILRTETQIMLDMLQLSCKFPGMDYNRAKELVARIFDNELDYLMREPSYYYELYFEEYHKQ
jgi:hypothetical protein